MDNSVMKKLVAEMIGTFVLVFGGVGTAVLAGAWVGALGVALAFGFTLLVMAYAIGPISGCHINPAVTLGMFMSKKIGGKEALLYMLTQVIGPFWPPVCCSSSPAGSAPTATGTTPRAAMSSARSWSSRSFLPPS